MDEARFENNSCTSTKFTAHGGAVSSAGPLECGDSAMGMAGDTLVWRAPWSVHTWS